MKLKTILLMCYLVFGGSGCLWYAVAAAKGWKAPSFGIGSSTSSSGRSYGGTWGIGK